MVVDGKPSYILCIVTELSFDSQFLQDMAERQISFIPWSTLPRRETIFYETCQFILTPAQVIFISAMMSCQGTECLSASFIVCDCAFHRYAKAKGRALNSLSAVLKMRSQSVWEVSGRLRRGVITEWAVAKGQYTPWSVLCVFTSMRQRQCKCVIRWVFNANVMAIAMWREAIFWLTINHKTE